MGRRTYRQDAETREFYEVVKQKTHGIAPSVRGDIDPYISPVDGSVISSRSGERAHNKRHGVSNDQDSLREQTEKAGRTREVSPQERHERKLAIKDSMERVASSGFHRNIRYED